MNTLLSREYTSESLTAVSTTFEDGRRSEIYINLKMDADAGVAFVSGVQIICQGQ
jgi:hypothetical protein